MTIFRHAAYAASAPSDAKAFVAGPVQKHSFQIAPSVGGSWLMPAHHGLVCRLAKKSGICFHFGRAVL